LFKKEINAKEFFSQGGRDDNALLAAGQQRWKRKKIVDSG
jgi:hypothetical protein